MDKSCFYIEKDTERLLEITNAKIATSTQTNIQFRVLNNLQEELTQNKNPNDWILDIEKKIIKKNWEPNNDEKEFLINAINNQEIEISDLNSLRSEADFLNLKTEINNLQNEKEQVGMTVQFENEFEGMDI